MRIPLSRPSIGNPELKMVSRVFESGWLGEGKFTGMFEERIAAFTGAKHAVAVNTGTSALHLAMDALGIGKGDEVILPSLTFSSDPMAVVFCGAKPVFCDIDEDTLNIDPKKIGKLITPRTKAVMPTDFAGLLCDVKAIRRVIGRRNIKIIRDASHSFGSTSRSKVTGLLPDEDAVCCSFDPIKNLTCGEGGVILLKDGDIAEKIRSQKNLGYKKAAWSAFTIKRDVGRRVMQKGFRYHMSNINAAIGLAQLKRFEKLARKKQAIAKRYDGLLAKNENITLLKRNYDNIVPFMYIIRANAKDRDDLIKYLNDHDIHAALRYYPCHLQPFFRQGRKRLPVTERIAKEILSIPLFYDLTMKQVKRITSLINDYYGKGKMRR